MNSGECYLIKTPPNGKHLFVVTVLLHEDCYLLLPFITKKDHTDTACLIEPGNDAPSFIKHDTVISYRDAKELTEYAMKDAIKRSCGFYQETLSASLYRRILESALSSKWIKNRYKDLIREHLGR
jgi:hypothetical protein